MSFDVTLSCEFNCFAANFQSILSEKKEKFGSKKTQLKKCQNLEKHLKDAFCMSLVQKTFHTFSLAQAWINKMCKQETREMLAAKLLKIHAFTIHCFHKCLHKHFSTFSPVFLFLFVVRKQKLKLTSQLQVPPLIKQTLTSATFTRLRGFRV